MTYQRTRRAQRRTEIDRGTWAEYDKLNLFTTLEGSGEATTVVYFGQAFESPPYFTYSAAAKDTDVAFPEVTGSVFLHRDLAGAGPTNFSGSDVVHDHRSQASWLSDPSFELQGAWGDTYIPTWYEDDLTATTRTGWAGFQKISEEQAYKGPLSSYGNDFANSWVQEGGRSNRWALSSEEYFGDASDARYQGFWSAKYTFDGDTTRWLVPFSSGDGAFGYPHAWGHTDTEVSPHNWNIHEYDLVSYVLPQSRSFASLPYGSWAGPVGNPRINAYRHIVHAKSDAALTCEMQVNWINTDVTVGSEFEDKLVDDRYRIALMDTETTTVDLIPGQWTECVFDWSPPRWMWEPVVPWRGEVQPNEVAGGNNTVLFRFRFTGGSPNDVVYADEIYVHPVIETLPALPLLTVGVASWLRDDNGFYVGANLWLKSRSATGGVLT